MLENYHKRIRNHPVVKQQIEYFKNLLDINIRIFKEPDDGFAKRVGAYGIHSKKHGIKIFLQHGNRIASVGDVLFVLRHEVQHHLNLLMGNFYESTHITKKDNFIKAIRLASLLITDGYSTEMNCDRVAKEYVKKLGFHSRLSYRRYSVNKLGVPGWCLYHFGMDPMEYLNNLHLKSTLDRYSALYVVRRIKKGVGGGIKLIECNSKVVALLTKGNNIITIHISGPVLFESECKVRFFNTKTKEIKEIGLKSWSESDYWIPGDKLWNMWKKYS